MGVRYSDRFFEPRATRNAEELAAGVPNEGTPAASPLEDMVERRARPPRPHRLMVISVASGLVVGAAAGAYGWEQWRDREADASARSTVDIRAQGTVHTARPDEPEIAVSVRTYNDGAHPVALTALAASDARRVPTDHDFHVASIAAGEDNVTFMHFKITCARDAEPSPGAADLRAQVRTVDGNVHNADVAVTAYGGSLERYLSDWCNAAAYSQTFQDVFVDVVAVDPLGADAVASTVLFSYNDTRQDPQLEILELGSTSAAFTATWDDTVLLEPSTGSGTAIVTWSVRNCEHALASSEADMTLDVTGRLTPRSEPTDAPTTRTVVPTADLAAELARLAQRVCP